MSHDQLDSANLTDHNQVIEDNDSASANTVAPTSHIDNDDLNNAGNNNNTDEKEQNNISSNLYKPHDEPSLAFIPQSVQFLAPQQQPYWNIQQPQFQQSYHQILLNNGHPPINNQYQVYYNQTTNSYLESSTPQFQHLIGLGINPLLQTNQPQFFQQPYQQESTIGIYPSSNFKAYHQPQVAIPTVAQQFHNPNESHQSSIINQSSQMPQLNYNSRLFVPLYCGTCRAYGCQCFYGGGNPQQMPPQMITTKEVDDFANNSNNNNNTIINTSCAVSPTINNRNNESELNMAKESNGLNLENNVSIVSDQRSADVSPIFNVNDKQLNKNNKTTIEKQQQKYATAAAIAYYNYLQTSQQKHKIDNMNNFHNNDNNKLALSHKLSPTISKDATNSETNIDNLNDIFTKKISLDNNKKQQQKNLILNNNNNQNQLPANPSTDRLNFPFDLQHHQQQQQTLRFLTPQNLQQIQIQNMLIQQQQQQQQQLLNNAQQTLSTNLIANNIVYNNGNSNSNLNGVTNNKNPKETMTYYQSSPAPLHATVSLSHFFNNAPQNIYSHHPYHPHHPHQFNPHDSQVHYQLSHTYTNNSINRNNQENDDKTNKLTNQQFIPPTGVELVCVPTETINKSPTVGLSLPVQNLDYINQNIALKSQHTNNYNHNSKMNNKQNYNKPKIPSNYKYNSKRHYHSNKFDAYEYLKNNNFKATSAAASTSSSSPPLSVSSATNKSTKSNNTYNSRHANSKFSNRGHNNYNNTSFQSQTLCRFGNNCKFKRENKCKYYHSPSPTNTSLEIENKPSSPSKSTTPTNII